jgi:Dyp-type peroxidase family
VQGLVLRGYGQLPECRYLLLRIDDPAGAVAWLRQILPRVTPGQPAAAGEALQVAFTYAGLTALGLGAKALGGFSRELRDGMVSEHKSRFLGDEGESSPANWRWGGPNNPAVHVLLLLFADTPARLASSLAQIRTGLGRGGVSELLVLEASSLSRFEPFGFADGISQPSIEGYHPTASSLHQVKAGEFLLGYPNEYGQYTERPLLAAAQDPRARLGLDREGSPRHDLGRNGSYLVFRQLRQDVAAFRSTLDALTRRTDGSPDPEARARLAAKMVGRWPSGASLVIAPDADEPAAAQLNEFGYHHEDPEGLRCPLGSHVRRANPRDSLDPHPGTERSLRVNHRHRLLRRGRSYGAPLPGAASDGAASDGAASDGAASDGAASDGAASDGAASDGAERGIFFIALNANISRQFEFVQHSWLLDPHFNGRYAEADPIAGAADGNQFSLAGGPTPERCLGLPRFVSVVGGAYFFLPSLRALTFLAELGA